jgi:exopolysaccharide biosynthesis polyprenyl glycosylphosphotransferase
MNRRKPVRLAFAIADLLVLLGAAYTAAAWFSTDSARPTLAEMLHMRPQIADIAVAAALLGGWVGLMWYFGLYRQRYFSFLKVRPYHLPDLVKATSLGTLAVVAIAFIADLRFVTTASVAVLWLVWTGGTLLARELLIGALQQMRLNGRNLRHLLIVGTNSRAEEFASRVLRQPELGYSLRGFIDDKWIGPETRVATSPGIVASLATMGEYLKNNVVDEVLIALPIATLYQEAARVVRLCETHGIVVHFVPGCDFLNLGSSTASLDTLDDQPIITLVPPPMKGWQLIGKRMLDVVGAAVLIAVLTPVFVGVALMIKLTSTGPVFFVQNRMGLNKRVFRMIKFRTMVTDAEAMQANLEHLNEAQGPVFKIAHDPRITPVGAFLRKTSIDELPQLFNVLRGDMSLVGPRPLPLRDYAGFSEDWHRRRFTVRPGITCLWQIRGRSTIAFEQWMQLDMEYIKQWSLWLDLKILLQTVRAVLAQRGAV